MSFPATLSGSLDGLGALLETASALVRELSSDPLRKRFLQTYDRMPAEDRAVIVDVLEREVEVRVRTIGDGERMTGIGARPNPNAQLYVRVLEKTPEAPPPFDHEQMVFSNVRAAHMMRHALAPERHGPWRSAVTEAYATLEPEVRRDAARVLRILLEILDVPSAA